MKRISIEPRATVAPSGKETALNTNRSGIRHALAGLTMLVSGCTNPLPEAEDVATGIEIPGTSSDTSSDTSSTEIADETGGSDEEVLDVNTDNPEPLEEPTIIEVYETDDLCTLWGVDECEINPLDSAIELGMLPETAIGLEGVTGTATFSEFTDWAINLVSEGEPYDSVNLPLTKQVIDQFYLAPDREMRGIVTYVDGNDCEELGSFHFSVENDEIGTFELDTDLHLAEYGGAYMAMVEFDETTSGQLEDDQSYTIRVSSPYAPDCHPIAHLMPTEVVAPSAPILTNDVIEGTGGFIPLSGPDNFEITQAGVWAGGVVTGDN